MRIRYLFLHALFSPFSRQYLNIKACETLYKNCEFGGQFNSLPLPGLIYDVCDVKLGA